jgi:hypothetical protein
MFSFCVSAEDIRYMSEFLFREEMCLGWLLDGWFPMTGIVKMGLIVNSSANIYSTLASDSDAYCLDPEPAHGIDWSSYRIHNTASAGHLLGAHEGGVA